VADFAHIGRSGAADKFQKADRDIGAASGSQRRRVYQFFTVPGGSNGVATNCAMGFQRIP